MAVSKVAGYVLAGVVTVGSLSVVATQNSDKIFDTAGKFKNQIETLWEGNNTLKALLEGRDSLLATLQGEANTKINEANGKIANMNATIQAKLSEIGLLQAQVEDKNAEISNLQAQLEAEGGSNAELQAQLDEATSDKQRLEQELQALADYVSQLEADLQSKGITDESIVVNAEDYAVGTYQLDAVADGTSTTTPPTEAPSEDTSNEDTTPSQEEPQQELTTADKIELELRTATNYNNLKGYQVDLIDQSNENWFFVEVVQTGVDYQGKPQVDLVYTVKNTARSLVSTTQINNTGKTLQQYLNQQQSDMATKHNVIVTSTKFVTEGGTLKSFMNVSDGTIKNR